MTTDGPRPGRPGRAALLVPCLGAAAFGLAWFVAAGGGRIVSPGALDWLGTADYAANVSGWLWFHDAAWRWPPGRVTGYLAPAGTSLGLTDALPWVAVAAKLAAPVLPHELQYFGAWMAVSFGLQGAAGALLAGTVAASPVHRLLAGALFATSPFLLWRVGHPSLTAHWTLLVALWLALRRGTPADLGATLAYALALCAFVAGTHPYLAAMVVALLLAVPWRLARTGWLRPAAAALAGAAMLVVTGTVFLLFGYLSAPGRARGYGYFTADLLTFVNPMGWSRFLPGVAVGPGQGEGFAYLGAGVLALLAWAAATAWRARRRRPRPSPVAVVVIAVLLALSAALPVVTVAGGRIASFQRVLAPLAPLTSALRSSGRFVWPLAYLLVLAGVAATVRWLPPRRATAALAAALALQVVDLGPGLRTSRFDAVPWRAASPTWWLAAGGYDAVALHPAYYQDGDGPVCRKGENDPAWIPFAYRAWRIGAALESGYGPRLDRGKAIAACRAAELELASGALRPRVIHVVPAAEVPRLAGRPGTTCGVVDGASLCVVAPEGDPLRAALASRAAGR